MCFISAQIIVPRALFNRPIRQLLSRTEPEDQVTVPCVLLDASD